MKTKIFQAIGVALCAMFAVPAFACGGFFCNQSQPVSQAAERVLYLQGAKSITAHIQISYSGPSEKFSWVLPLAKVPKLGIGSDSIFTVLDNYTRPNYQLQMQNEANCSFQQCMYAMSAGAENDSGGTKSANGVKVLAAQAIGPYLTETIQGDSGADLQKWLTTNGYDQPASTATLLDLYAKKGFVFLAVKLKKDKDAGDLAPIVVTVDEVSPCLPIRLTGLAANPDMPILIWTLGNARAIPKNYLHVVLNPKVINWLAGGDNYFTVASKAIDQASGHAFITEYAGKTAAMPMQFANPSWDTSKLKGIFEPAKFMQMMMQQGFVGTRQLQHLIQVHIPKPADYATKTDQEFYGCVQSNCGEQASYPCDPTCAAIKAAVKLQKFDPIAFAMDLEDNIVLPLQDVQKTYNGSAYLTRLLTMVDPAEMDKDPIFAWNPDLKDVSNQHSAKAKPICVAGSTKAVKAELSFEDGTNLTMDLPPESTNCFGGGGFGFGGGGPIGFGSGQSKQNGPLVAAGGQPAKSIQVIDESGQPLEIDQGQADRVDAELNNAQAGKPSLPADFVKALPPVTWNPYAVATAAPTVAPASGGGCAVAPTSQTPWVFAVVVLGGIVALRRRRA